MDNHEIARQLKEVADLLEIRGANPFRVRAYRNAVRTVEAQTVPLARRRAAGESLTALPGIGTEMARHIGELVETGSLEMRERLAAEIPPGLIELKRLPGVGAKRAKQLWQALGAGSVEALEEAARAGKVAALPGFGARSQERILEAIAERRQHTGRRRIDEADRLAEPLVRYVEGLPGVERVAVAGSFRRRAETVRDLDLLAVAADPEATIAAFADSTQVARVEGAGGTRASVVLGSGLAVDLRVVPAASWGAALIYFTGSKEHNVRLRMRAVGMGLKVNEYGVFAAGEEDSGEAAGPTAGERRGGTTEEEVYAAVGLAWIPPELREDRGEIAAAARDELPRLVTVDDLRGDLQMHSTWSDGRASIEAMVVACAERGYEYMALTDHSQALALAGGFDARRLRQQWKEIDEVQARHPGIRILKSQEIDILADGTLDLDDATLAELDMVLVSIHSRFRLPANEQTRRLVRAVQHPQVNILAHPTGRLIGRRRPYAFDLDEVLRACADHGVAVELNSHPNRLDLKDTHLLRARELGVPVVISTDAHRIRELAQVRYGVEQARRAWLGPGEVLNTRPLGELQRFFAK